MPLLRTRVAVEEQERQSLKKTIPKMKSADIHIYHVAE
jgi:hypothetical protein